MAAEVMDIDALPYHIFKKTESKRYLEGRFWNQDGKQLAIVAVVTKNIDWAAYIGTDAARSYSEDDTLNYIAERGCKLLEKDAKHFFPKIELPYRY